MGSSQVRYKTEGYGCVCWRQRKAGITLTDALEAYAARLSRSGWRRHVLFMLATLVAVLYTGYHFGTFDQVVHIQPGRHVSVALDFCLAEAFQIRYTQALRVAATF